MQSSQNARWRKTLDGWVEKLALGLVDFGRAKFAFSRRMEGLNNLPVRLNNLLGACRFD